MKEQTENLEELQDEIVDNEEVDEVIDNNKLMAYDIRTQDDSCQFNWSTLKGITHNNGRYQTTNIE